MAGREEGEGRGRNYNRGVARRGFYKDCARGGGFRATRKQLRDAPAYCTYYTNLAHVLYHGTLLHFHCDDPLPVIDCIISLSTSSASAPRPTIELRSDTHSTLSVGLVG